MSAATDAARQSVADARTIYEHAIVNAPRSLQTQLGPSQLGTDCTRCLIHMLAGTPEVDNGRAPWLPTVGNAVHEWAEMAMVRHLIDTGTDRWLSEARVNVGTLRDVPVWGTCDLFDRELGVVIDLKVVGETTRKKVRADGSGTSLTYQRQVQLYGKGMANAGEEVNAVAVWFIGRNTLTLTVDRLFVAEYDETEALRVLERANRFATWIDHFGAEQVLASAPAHTGQEFSCDRMPDSPRNVPATVAGLIPTAS